MRNGYFCCLFLNRSSVHGIYIMENAAENSKKKKKRQKIDEAKFNTYLWCAMYMIETFSAKNWKEKKKRNRLGLLVACYFSFYCKTHLRVYLAFVNTPISNLWILYLQRPDGWIFWSIHLQHFNNISSLFSFTFRTKSRISIPQSRRLLE